LHADVTAQLKVSVVARVARAPLQSLTAPRSPSSGPFFSSLHPLSTRRPVTWLRTAYPPYRRRNMWMSCD
jgi:hypothetical protein